MCVCVFIFLVRSLLVQPYVFVHINICTTKFLEMREKFQICRVHNYDNYVVCIIEEGFSRGSSKNFKIVSTYNFYINFCSHQKMRI